MIRKNKGKEKCILPDKGWPMPSWQETRVEGRATMTTDRTLHTLRLGMNDLAVIAAVLEPYQAFIARQMPRCFEKMMLLLLLHNLRERLDVRGPCCEHAVFLSEEEIALIRAALRFFIEYLPKVAPSSPGLQELLGSCKQLLAAMQQVFPTI